LSTDSIHTNSDAEFGYFWGLAETIENFQDESRVEDPTYLDTAYGQQSTESFFASTKSDFA